jgi:DNA-binding MarR family transcriptional regulator
MKYTTLSPYHMKILVMLYKLQVLGSRRIGDIFRGGRETAEKYLRELETMGFARIQAGKPFRDREANLWELTEEGRAFVEAELQSGSGMKLKISEMNRKLAAVCSEVVKLLEKPLSFDELLTALNASGIKIRKYKLGDVLKILEAAGQVIKVPGYKKIGSVPGGVVVYMKTEGADIESAAL